MFMLSSLILSFYVSKRVVLGHKNREFGKNKSQIHEGNNRVHQITIFMKFVFPIIIGRMSKVAKDQAYEQNIIQNNLF